jgi:Tol biopolymer transport system component
MPIKRKLSLLLLTLAVALLGLPAAAQATLAYVKGSFEGTIYAADDNGHNPRAIGIGYDPHVSPDGNWVAYRREVSKIPQELKLAPSSGGPGRTLKTNFPEVFDLAWSPDSTHIAAVVGPEIGPRRLVLLDLASGTQTFVARGYFGGFSFSPESSEIAYSVSQSEDFPPRSDVFRFPVPIPGVVNVRAPEPVRLTRDHRSSDPVWGPEKIVFVKTVGAKKRRYGGKNELFLMNSEGKQVRRLTHTRVDPLLQGLFPTEWSTDGSRLLTEFEGQDVSYAVLVNPKTGAQKPVAGTGEQGFVGTDLSADGKLVLGFNGGFDPGLRNHKVQTVPSTGGRPTTLVKEAFEPSWNR